MRQVTLLKLLLKLLFVAGWHVGILFLLYGWKLVPNLSGWGTIAWLLLPSCVAFCLYYLSLSRSVFANAPHRQGKLTTCSLAATLFSLYGGVFFALNSFGS